MMSSPWIENVKWLEPSARTFSAIPSDRIWSKRRAALNFSARISRRKTRAHLSMLYLTMLMSDIDFSRISAKLSDKWPPCDRVTDERGSFAYTMEGPRSVRPNVANDCHFPVSDEGSGDAVRIRTSYRHRRALVVEGDARSPLAGAVRRRGPSPALPRTGRTDALRAP